MQYIEETENYFISWSIDRKGDLETANLQDFIPFAGNKKEFEDFVCYVKQNKNYNFEKLTKVQLNNIAHFCGIAYIHTRHELVKMLICIVINIINKEEEKYFCEIV